MKQPIKKCKQNSQQNSQEEVSKKKKMNLFIAVKKDIAPTLSEEFLDIQANYRLQIPF